MRLLSTLLLAPGAALAPIERRSLFKGAALSSAVGAAPEFLGWNAEESSWPILLDEFVEFAMAKKA